MSLGSGTPSRTCPLCRFWMENCVLACKGKPLILVHDSLAPPLLPVMSSKCDVPWLLEACSAVLDYKGFSVNEENKEN